MLDYNETSLSRNEIKTIDSVLGEFELSLEHLEQDSKDALALALFINSCYDRRSFQSDKFAALGSHQRARKSAYILTKLIEIDTRLFQKSIPYAKTILRDSLLLNVDFFSVN